MRWGVVRAVIVAGIGVVPLASLAAQSLTQPTAAQLERRGQYAEAAQGYVRSLTVDPADLSALLGLERVLTRLERLPDIFPFIARALEQAPGQEMIRELDFRVTSGTFGRDSARAVFERWRGAMPASANPYRLYAFWLAGDGDVPGALDLLGRGDRQLGGARLAAYRAQIVISVGDWLLGAREWRLAADTDPSLVHVASGSLGRTPDEFHDAVLGALLGSRPSNTARQIGADLLARWGRAGEGWAMLDASLPANDFDAAAVLRRFADRAGSLGTADGHRARGYALERLAERQVGAEAGRTRVEAARAFADAGDLQAAQRLLNRAPRTRTTEADEALATATLIRVLAEAGRLVEAEDRFHEWEARLTGDDRADLRHRIAWGWVTRTEFDRAEQLLVSDSSVAAEAINGWVALYRGELAVAKGRFQTAGPFAQSREEVTRRSAMLVLLEQLELSRSSALGQAFLSVARGDSARGVTQIEAVAEAMTAARGRAALLLYAAQLRSAQKDFAGAVPVYQAAIATDTMGPAAPAAELALAVALVELGRRTEAAEQLEHLILTHHDSALVPQARRILGQLQGVIPKS